MNQLARRGECDVVDAIRQSATELGDLEVADQFLRLGVDRDCWLAGVQGCRHPCVDVMELRIAIRGVAPLTTLAVTLRDVIAFSQQVSDHVVTNAMAHCLQRFGQVAQATARPQQRRLRTAAYCRFDQTLQVRQRRGVNPELASL